MERYGYVPQGHFAVSLLGMEVCSMALSVSDFCRVKLVMSAI